MAVLRPWLRNVSALFFPPSCTLCGDVGEDWEMVLCDGCRLALTKPPHAMQSSFYQCAEATTYGPPIDSQIHLFKYPPSGSMGLNPSPARLLKHLILEAAAAIHGPSPDAILPIPLHRRRLHQRGFNPACVLARALAHGYGIPCLPVALTRLRDTPSQTGLGRLARRKNVRGAFAYRGKRPTPKSVWLVDDVVTTGATTEEAARVLHKVGVEEVTVICVARTPSPRGPTLRAALCAGVPDRQVF